MPSEILEALWHELLLLTYPDTFIFAAMRISLNWLKDFIDLPQSPADIAAILTNTGLEVESIEDWESVKGSLKGLVVGEVKECLKHPNADKLTLCKVDAGTNELLQIVCGAPNVSVNQKVIVALPGTIIHPASGEPFEIKKSKIRGESSNGMLCAEDEIGLGTSHAGLLILNDNAAIGSPVADYFDLITDTIFEIGLTPNRADAASHLGVARDLKAALSEISNTELKMPAIKNFSGTNSECPVKVEIKELQACPRYSGIYISNLNVAASPEWIQQRLKAAGMRPVNNIVDIGNYVMLESGQPLHVFDADKISGKKIIVQTLAAGTAFKTLDGENRKLSGRELMICDENEGLCIAGIFGGVNSGVTDQTKDIFIESAYFDPVSIRKSAKQHGLYTDSSFRFERGTDPENTVTALKRAASLVIDLCGGVASSVVDIYPDPLKPYSVYLKYDYVHRLSGINISADEIKKILQSLFITIQSETNDGLQLSVPRFRTDVTRPADVVEEILRIYGYNRIPLPEKMNSSMPVFKSEDNLSIQKKISEYLASQGFNEILNNSLTKKTGSGENQTKENVYLLNPLSNDLNMMRESLLFSGLNTVAYNQNRKQVNVRLFEFGNTYLKSLAGFEETAHLALLLSGKRYEENWMQLNRSYDIYYLKTIIENVFLMYGVERNVINISEENDDYYSSCLKYAVGKKEIATIGRINKKILKTFDIDSDVFYADINVDNIGQFVTSKAKKIKELSRFPSVKRDLSMLLDQHIRYEQVEKIALETENHILKDIRLFDVYEGEKIEAGKKSYAISFILEDEKKTLEDKQIDIIMNRLMQNFEKKLGAVIRKR